MHILDLAFLRIVHTLCADWLYGVRIRDLYDL